MDAVAEGSKGRVPRDCIGLVTSRAAVGELLKLDHLIDLVIPRGSGSLVNHIKVCACGRLLGSCWWLSGPTLLHVSVNIALALWRNLGSIVSVFVARCGTRQRLLVRCC